MTRVRINNQGGITLVEVLVSMVIVTIVGIFTAVSVVQYATTRSVMLQDTQKLYLAEEGYEIIRFVRDEDWHTIADLAVDTHHYLDISSTTVAVSAEAEELPEGFTRMFVLHPLYRNTGGTIVDAADPAGVVDEQGRWLEVFVVDEQGTTTLETVVTNLHAI